eukprot:scaffold23730_cov127-Cylindrotheca_fusiformis.AAC.3
MKLKSELDPHSSRLRESILCDACANTNPSCRCANCHLTFYCHEACSQNHWQVHKAYCKSPADILKESQLVQAPDDESNHKCEMCERNSFDHSQYYYYQQKAADSPCCKRTYCLQCMDHYQAYTSSLLITSSKAATTCPLCRVEKNDLGDQTDTNYNFYQAAFWTAKAASTTKDPLRSSKFANKALDYIEGVLDQDSNNQAAKIFQGRILGLLGESALGLILLRESLQKLQTTVPQQQKVDILMNQVKEKMMDGKAEEAEALLTEIQTLRNHKFALLVQPTDLIDLQLSVAELEMVHGDWSASLSTLKQILSTSTALTPNQQLQAYLQFAKCCHATKQYDKAIESSRFAIDMNRHYPEVYTYLVLAHLAKGERDLAESAASHSVLYETPWDPQNHQRTLQRYQEMFETATK